MNPFDLINLKNNIERTLHKDRELWTRKEAIKFLKILNIDSTLKDHFDSLGINGEKLFTAKYGPVYLLQHLQDRLNQINYLSVAKLLIIIQWMNNQLQDPYDYIPAEFEVPESPNQRLSVIGSTQSENLYHINYQQPRQKYIEFSEQLMSQIISEFDKKQCKNIVDMKQQQIIQIMCKIKCNKYCRVIQEYHIDGFALIYTAMDEDIKADMKNYFPEVELALIQQLAQLFVFLYYRQLSNRDPQYSTQLPQSQPQLNHETTQESQTESSPDILLRRESKKLRASKQVQITDINTELVSRKDSKQKQDEQQVFSNLESSELNFNDILTNKAIKNEQQVRKSLRESINIRKSDVRYSDYAVSEYDESQMGSVYASSVIMDSYAQSVMIVDSANQLNTRPVSTIQDVNNFSQLKQISMNLPFNLFNLDPLNWIRITELQNPFAKALQNHLQAVNNNQTIMAQKKNIYPLNSKVFSLRGAKFGRQKENDFCYPDQCSVSGNHARVFFVGGSFYLQDLGSKTGTFIRIQQPMVLNDGAIIQLSYEVQILFKILKKQQNEAVARIQFLKPENFQGYRVSVKQGFPIKIGRSDNSHIKIDDKRTKVSAKHAYIKYQGKNFEFVDRNSSGGSWLRLSKKGIASDKYKLSLGDIFRLSSRKSFIVEEMKVIVNGGFGNGQQKKE